MQDRAIVDMNIDLEDFFQTKTVQVIEAITGDEQPLWGMMSIHHMLEHLVFPLEFVLFNEKVQLITPAEKLPRQREFLYSEYGMPVSSKPPFLPKDETVPLKTATLQEAKDQLKRTISQFLHTINKPDFTTLLHPLFGRLDKREWLIFQYKHFMHHFMQFGLV